MNSQTLFGNEYFVNVLLTGNRFNLILPNVSLDSCQTLVWIPCQTLVSVVENDAKNNWSPLVGRFVVGERSRLVGRFIVGKRSRLVGRFIVGDWSPWKSHSQLLSLDFCQTPVWTSAKLKFGLLPNSSLDSCQTKLNIKLFAYTQEGNKLDFF